MRTISAFFFLAIMQLSASAQSSCKYYILQDSSIITFRVYDRKGDPDGRLVYSTGKVYRQKGIDSVRLLAEQFDRKGIRISSYTALVQYSRGILWWDMGLTGPSELVHRIRSLGVRTEQAFLPYPDFLQIGDSLEDGFMEMYLGLEGKTLSRVGLSVTRRRVRGRERIITPAGAWDCYRISYTARLRTTFFGIGFPLVFHYQEWFAPGIGMVKRQAYRRKHKPGNSLLLVSIQQYP